MCFPLKTDLTAFQDIEHVYVDHSTKSSSKKWVFCVKTTTKSYTLCAPSAETMRIWVDVIFTGADGHPDAYGLPMECQSFKTMQ